MLCSLSTRLRRLPSAWLALLILVSISLSKEPSKDMVLPRYLKCSMLASGRQWGGWGRVVQVGGASPSFRDLLSGWRIWMSQRSSPASAVGLVLRGPLVHSRRQREPLGGEFAGSSSLEWVDADQRGSHPSGNKCRTPSPDLGQHGTAYRRKRHWRGPELVCSPASRHCWSRKHPSHCHWRGPGKSCRHGRAWSSTPTLEDNWCVQGLSKVPPSWRCQTL